MEYKCLSDFLFKGENKNINISVSKNSPVNASLSLDGYKHSMVQIIALTIALKMKTVIVNPPIVSDTYVFIAIINELGGTAKIYNKRLFIDASTICNANIPFFLGKCIHGSMYLCPALLIALGKFEYYGSGGCQIGDSIDSHNRPFSHIASVIECFNHKISIESNRIIGNFGDNSDITELDIKNFSYSSEDLSGPLVGGATKTALLKFIERYISEDLWEKLLSTYRMDSYENIWEALFLCHQLFRAVSGEVAERLHYAYPEYDRNITKYTRDMYKKYTGKTGCLDSTYAADIEERREQ